MGVISLFQVSAPGQGFKVYQAGKCADRETLKRPEMRLCLSGGDDLNNDPILQLEEPCGDSTNSLPRDFSESRKDPQHQERRFSGLLEGLAGPLLGFASLRAFQTGLSCSSGGMGAWR